MTMTAKYPGKCRKCGQAINAGDTIDWKFGEGAAHVTCPTTTSPAPSKSTAKLDASKLFKMFDVAKAHLKYPKVHVMGEVPMKLYVAGERSSAPGSLQIIRTSDKEWLGRVLTDGTISISAKIGPELRSTVSGLLQEFSKNPAEYAKLHGIQTGCCCFCGRTLEDYRSVGNGYGPVCASNFGLPWGDVDKAAIEANRAEVEHLAFAVGQ